MNKDMREIAAGAIKIATDAGASAAAADITSRRRVEIGYRERKPETIKESSTRDLQLSLYVDGRYSAQGTSDLRPAALKKFVTDAVAATRLIAPDPMRTLPDPKYYQGRVERDLGLVDPAYSSWTAADRHAWAKALEAACLARGKDRLVSVSTQVADSHVDHLRLASNGFEGAEESTFYQAVLRVTAQDQGDRRPNGFNFAVAMSRKALPSPEEIGAVAADRTLALLGARRSRPRRCRSSSRTGVWTASSARSSRRCRAAPCSRSSRSSPTRRASGSPRSCSRSSTTRSCRAGSAARSSTPRA